ncbi:alanine/glycine:cation symporter family protein [candidate division KSB1 bacterium]
MVLLDEIVKLTGAIVWGPHMLLLLIGTGIFLTWRLYGIQFHRFLFAVKYILLGIRRKDKSQDKSGDISPFQALMTSLAAAVGNGNIAGVATAIALGGPGAIFWMWLSAVVGMATKFSEVLLGVHFRKSNSDGTVMGGPMIYLHEAIKWKGIGRILAGFSAFAMGMKALFTPSLVQSNSIALAVETHLGINTWVTGIFLAIITWIVIVGGIKSIGRFAEFISPFMSILYIAAGIAVMIVFWRAIPTVFGAIFSQAFTGTAAVGGFTGSTVMMGLRYGVARGSYSNEAGIGSSAVAHAAAKTDQPVRQGIIAMMDVFIDTILICTITAFVVLATGEWETGTSSTEAVTNAFEMTIPFGGWIVVLSSLLFGYSSMISWPYMGAQSFAYLFGLWVKKYFAWVFCVLVIFGSSLKVNTVWLIGDTLNGLMAIPNLIGLIALSGIVVKLTKIYFNQNTQ